jgi:2'-5' RNA ligase
MDGCNGDGNRINSFALVSYLGDPLAAFLDRLRTDLVRECHAKAHVTVLPPRKLSCTPDEAWQQIHTTLQNFQRFRVELGDIDIFPETQVIYLSIRAGRKELDQLHHMLNTGCLAFQEPYTYHPHVTLGQDIPPDRIAESIELARARWREFPHRPDFVVDRLTFVQNSLQNLWTDLNGMALAESKMDHSNISI